MMSKDALTDIIADTGPLQWPQVAQVAQQALCHAHGGFRLAAYGVLHQAEAVLSRLHEDRKELKV